MLAKRRKIVGDGSGEHESNEHISHVKYQTDDYSTMTEESTAEDSSGEESEDKYEWEREKQRKIQFFDDGTMSYFWYVHCKIQTTKRNSAKITVDPLF